MPACADGWGSLWSGSAQPPAQRSSPTSVAAAERIAPRAATHERDVYEAIVRAGKAGATRKELAALLPWADRQQNRITGRVATLIASGLVRERDWRDEPQRAAREGAATPLRAGDPWPSWANVRRDGSAVLVATRYVGRAG